MAIRKRGASWQADLTVQGKRVRETFNTEADAKAWELDVRAAVMRGSPIPRPKRTGTGTARNAEQFQDDGSTTLGAVLRRTFEKFWRGGRSEGKMLVNMAQVEAYFGKDTPIARINTDAIDGFITHCISKANSNGTINRKLAVLSKALRFAHDRGLINRLPRIERKQEVGGRIRYLTVEEETKLLDLFRSWEKHDHADVVTCLIDTGLRPSELYRLTPRDIDLKEGTITVWMSKTDKPRSVYMTRRVKEIVGRRMGAVTALTAPLFPFDNLWMRYVWDRARVTLGYAQDENFVPYICRHTCASRLVQRGVPINVVREWLGHTSIQMTMRYAFLAPRNLMSAATALEAAE